MIRPFHLAIFAIAFSFVPAVLLLATRIAGAIYQTGTTYVLNGSSGIGNYGLTGTCRGPFTGSASVATNDGNPTALNSTADPSRLCSDGVPEHAAAYYVPDNNLSLGGAAVTSRPDNRAGFFLPSGQRTVVPLVYLAVQ
jgi:hypothetical protein